MNPWENYAASGCEYKFKNEEYNFQNVISK